MHRSDKGRVVLRNKRVKELLHRQWVAPDLPQLGKKKVAVLVWVQAVLALMVPQRTVKRKKELYPPVVRVLKQRQLVQRNPQLTVRR